MIIGICFIFIGVFFYIEKNYNIDIVDGQRIFSKKRYMVKDSRYKALTRDFPLLLGIFRILSAIIY
ncbi:hypothetical protein [Tissierella sp.]|uniref:hypothetical protein n=1 Tax=Tissierella sp. TaxID=41274 RepID=UPI0028A93369|nr:hypothetical protein [Tissierella sp.]